MSRAGNGVSSTLFWVLLLLYQRFEKNLLLTVWDFSEQLAQSIQHLLQPSRDITSRFRDGVIIPMFLVEDTRDTKYDERLWPMSRCLSSGYTYTERNRKVFMRGKTYAAYEYSKKAERYESVNELFPKPERTKCTACSIISPTVHGTSGFRTFDEMRRRWQRERRLVTWFRALIQGINTPLSYTGWDGWDGTTGPSHLSVFSSGTNDPLTKEKVENTVFLSQVRGNWTPNEIDAYMYVRTRIYALNKRAELTGGR